MRTIKKTFAARLAAQAKEAELQGMKKTADSLRTVAEEATVRDTDEGYIYAASDLASDVEANMWRSIVRTADYFNSYIDAGELQPMVEKYAKHLIDDIRKHVGVRHGVGAYESTVPGQQMSRASIEVEEEDV